MSALSDVLAQSSFWWGVPSGAVLSGLVTAGFGARSQKKSDERKANQELRIRAEERRDLQNQQMREEALRFADTFASGFSQLIELSTAVELPLSESDSQERLVEAIKAGAAETAKVSVILTRLQMTAPANLVTKAVQCQLALNSVTKAITDPPMQEAVIASASAAFGAYKNEFRRIVRDSSDSRSMDRLDAIFIDYGESEISASIPPAPTNVIDTRLKSIGISNTGVVAYSHRSELRDQVRKIFKQ